MWLYSVSYIDHQIYKFLQFNDVARVLSDVTRGLVLSSDNPLEFYYQNFRGIYRLAEILNNFECHHPLNDFWYKYILNQMLEVLLFYFALLLILLLLLVLPSFCLNLSYLWNKKYYIFLTNFLFILLLTILKLLYWLNY